MLKVKDLNFSIEGEKLLKNINFIINTGEIVGIIGPSASGKSLLLNILCGNIKGYNGEIIINSLDFKTLNKKELYKQITKIKNSLPENTDITVKDYLELARVHLKRFMRPLNDLDHQKVEEILTILNLNPIKDKSLSKLSNCQLKLSSIAYEFSKNSTILLLKNPTDGLDLNSINILRKAILKYAINGEKIVMIASNEINIITQTADRIILLNNGTIVEDFIPESLTSEIIKEHFGLDVFLSRNIYNGRPEIHLFPEN